MAEYKCTRRAFLAATTTTALAGSACSTFMKKATRPNVIFIVVDTLRADRLNAALQDVPIMPNHQNISDNAIVCTEAYVQETFTKPSVASMFTSLYPDVHGVRFGSFVPAGMDDEYVQDKVLHVDVLPEHLPSLPTMLQQNGYTTIGVQTNMQLHPQAGFANGFDEYQYLGNVRATAVSKQAAAIIEHVKEPFFLYVHYMDPHCPYTPPRAVVDIFDPPERPAPQDVELIQNYREYYLDLVQYGLGLSEEREMDNMSKKGRNFIKFLYNGEVRYADFEVVRLIAFIRKHYPESLIVITSDHGEEFWEHGSIGHTKTAYRELAHVPLLFLGPDLSPQEVNTPIESIDIVPTIADYLDLPLQNGWQGESLLPLFVDNMEPERQFIYTSAFGMQPWDDIQWRTIYDGNYRLVMNLSEKEAELFNIASDPFEQEPLVGKETERKEGLKKALAQIAEENENHPLKQETVEKVQVDEQTIEALQALGYLQ